MKNLYLLFLLLPIFAYSQEQVVSAIDAPFQKEIKQLSKKKKVKN